MGDMTERRKEELGAWLTEPMEAAREALGAAAEEARRWLASEVAGDTPLPDLAVASMRAKEAQAAAWATLDAVRALTGDA